jgi:hypothetical protein
VLVIGAPPGSTQENRVTLPSASVPSPAKVTVLPTGTVTSPAGLTIVPTGGWFVGNADSWTNRAIEGTPRELRTNSM